MKQLMNRLRILRPSKLIRPEGTASAPLTVAASDDQVYTSGYTDDQVEATATEDGNAAVHNRQTWAENAKQFHFIAALYEAFASLCGLVGHRFRKAVQDVVEEVKVLRAEYATQIQNAFRAVDREKHAQSNHIRLRHKIRESGLEIPTRLQTVVWLLVIAMLFLGDLPVLSLGFQILGLSDAPLIPNIPLTNELNLAALASVTAILILAHKVGTGLREITFEMEAARRATTPSAKAKLIPWPRYVAPIIVGVVISVLALMFALGQLRVDYLSINGTTNVAWWVFLMIQLGVLTAAIIQSYEYHNHFRGDWKHSERALEAAKSNVAKATEAVTTTVGRHNVIIQQPGLLLADAEKHIYVGLSNTRRQVALYLRRDQLSQPEPTRDQLYPDQMPALPGWLPHDGSPDESIKQYLIGISPLPELEPLSLGLLESRMGDAREYIERLQEQLSDQNKENIDQDEAKPAQLDFDELEREFKHDDDDDFDDTSAVTS